MNKFTGGKICAFFLGVLTCLTIANIIVGNSFVSAICTVGVVVNFIGAYKCE